MGGVPLQFKKAWSKPMSSFFYLTSGYSKQSYILVLNCSRKQRSSQLYIKITKMCNNDKVVLHSSWWNDTVPVRKIKHDFRFCGDHGIKSRKAWYTGNIVLMHIWLGLYKKIHKIAKTTKCRNVTFGFYCIVVWYLCVMKLCNWCSIILLCC